MRNPFRLLLVRLRALLGPDTTGARQSMVALVLNSSTSLVAGAFLGGITGTFERYPGLLVLVPAAIGIRGNIFGAFGNRLSTAMHAGTFRLSLRRETVLGQNVLGAMILTAGMSGVLAVIATAAAVGVDVEGSIGLLDMATVSIVGGVLGSLAVLVADLGLAVGATRYGWDLDNVSAPIASVLGDVLTLPALYAATFLLGFAIFTPSLGVLLVVAVAAPLLVVGWMTPAARPAPHRQGVGARARRGRLHQHRGGHRPREVASPRSRPIPACSCWCPPTCPRPAPSAGSCPAGSRPRCCSATSIRRRFPAARPGATSSSRCCSGSPIYLFNAVGAWVVSGWVGAASPGSAR